MMTVMFHKNILESENIFNTLVYIEAATKTQRQPDDLSNLLRAKLTENTVLDSSI